LSIFTPYNFSCRRKSELKHSTSMTVPFVALLSWVYKGDCGFFPPPDFKTKRVFNSLCRSFKTWLQVRWNVHTWLTG
jgi:hypothetical protein